MEKVKNFKEKQLQDAVHFLLSDQSAVRRTKSGKRLQMLSTGRLNVLEGPDFIEIAVMLDGMVLIGDAEFHKKSSDWLAHSHDSDKRYDSVILHIVIEDNVELPKNNFDVLQLSEEEVLSAMVNLEKAETNKPDIFSLEELQHYALLRLLRKTSIAQKLINAVGLEETLKTLVREYIDKYQSRRKRPVYTSDNLALIPEEINNSHVYKFLLALIAGEYLHIPDMMQMLVKTKMLEEGSHFRRELLLNCILPVALCLANEEARINLFLWFWSTPALHTYGVLKRRFKEFPQNFLWQQQGMLEYIKEHGKRINVVSEALKDYGFAECLSFYRLGRAPFKELGEEG